MDPTEVAQKRQQLQLKYDAKIKPVAKRLQKRLNEIKRQAAGNRRHHSSDKELQDAARKDPNFIADSNLFAKLEAEYEAADAALGGHSAVASGWFGDYEKNSPEEAVLKAIRGIQQHEGFASWWNLPRADVDRPRSPPATHPYETTKKGQPKLDPKEGTSKDHPHATLDEKELSKRLASSHPVRPWADYIKTPIRIPLPTGLGHVQDSGSAGSPTSWVSATSVGVVVAMCACVAAFTVVRRRQRQSASAAPVVDGYATLV